MQTGLSATGAFSPARPIPTQGLGADQTPDEGAEAFVRDAMVALFGIDISSYPDVWAPLVILGTLDWIFICNWWAWYYTGIFQSDESYKWVFRYHSTDVDESTGNVEQVFYEFDPDRLVVFLEDVELNTFDERWEAPGLTDRERGEVLQFLRIDVFEAMEQEPPPQGVLERLAYCTFMWVLSQNGREWLCEIDPVWDCVDEFDIAYLERWEDTLLDPSRMEKTKRKLGACAFCGESLYCVSTAALFNDWVNICNDCLVAAHEQGAQLDLKDRRITDPLCSFRGGGCINTSCKHNPITREDLGDAMAAAGAQRVEAWRSARIQSNEPRTLAGRTVEQAVDYFQHIDYSRVLSMIRNELVGKDDLEAVSALERFVHDPNVRDPALLKQGCSTLLQLYRHLDWAATDDVEEIELILESLP